MSAQSEWVPRGRIQLAYAATFHNIKDTLKLYKACWESAYKTKQVVRDLSYLCVTLLDIGF
jgi:hypothetical protein